MSRTLSRSFAVLAALALLALGAVPGTAFGRAHAVRIDAADAAAAQSLVRAERSLDYGGFRWLELSAGEHARLLASGIRFQDVPDAFTIGIGRHRFDPLADGEPLAGDKPEAVAGAALRLVQLAGPTRPEWLAALAGNGLRVLQYYAHNTYLVWGDAPAAQAAAARPFVRWQGLFHPEYKLSEQLVGRQGRIANVDVTFYDAGNAVATLEALEALGARLLAAHPAQPDKAFWDAIVEVDAGALAAIARLPEVWWLGYESPRPVLDDEMSAQILAGNHPGGVPVTGYSSWLASVGLDGAGVTWAVVDTGIDYDHPDLGTHIVGGYDFPGACTQAGNPGSDCSGGGHGTHVAGIVGGDATGGFTDGGGFLYGLGIAPEVGFFAMNSLSAAAWPPSGGWQEHSKRAVLGGAIGGNNSWTTGEGTNHGYQASERTHDIMVRDGNFDTPAVAEPFIEVFSAGNSGSSPGTLTSPKEAKNLIIVASSRNQRVGSIDAISSFSSRGPAVDGRVGVTIAAPGEQIASSRNDLGGLCATAIGGTNNLYAFCSGTSMAAPHAAGAVVLLTDWWRALPEGGTDPSPAMARALLVNGAVDMGAPDVPNIHEGWGRIHLPNVVDNDTAMYYEDQATILGQTGEAVSLVVGVPDPAKPLKVTLAWSDAPGGVGANPALVNDLDLTVDTGGDTYLGNVFTAGWSATGGTADALHNLENVFVQATDGAATITVAAANIAGDGVPYVGDTTDQDFALVCYNCVQTPTYTLGVTPAEQAVCAPADAEFTIDVASVLGYTDDVTLGVAGNPAGTTAGFSTNPVTPSGSSTLTVGNTGAASGTHVLTVSAASTAGPRARDVELTIDAAAPVAADLLIPPDGATGVASNATFTWQPAGNGGTYTIEVATDAAFTNVVASASDLPTPSWQASALPTSAQLYWRVRATNSCGTSLDYPTFDFVTEQLVGDCPFGITPVFAFQDDMETGAIGWTSSGNGNTWALAGAQVHSGAAAFHADAPSTVSDQYLTSPTIDIPAVGDVTLQFWNRQVIEDRTAGCYDGAVLEISTDAGGTWTRIESELVTDPYDGPVSSCCQNPLANQNTWCGDPQDWSESIVDLTAFRGETAQFRFRLATDTSASREGWTIDDVVVQNCDSSIFVDGFESGDYSGGWTL